MYETLFQYGFIDLKTFNVFIALAFLLGVYLLLKYVSRNKLNVEFLTTRFVIISVLSLIGGRLFYIFEHLGSFKANIFSTLFIWDLKFSAYGLIYAGIAALYYYCKKDKEDFWSWLDGASISIIAAMVLVNIGHFFNGSYYGRPTDLPWGISFDTINIPFTTPIHPTQLYAALFGFILYFFVVKQGRRMHLSGMAGSLTIMLYSLGILGIDFLRGSPSTYSKANLAIIAAAAFIGYIHSSYKSHLPNNTQKNAN